MVLVRWAAERGWLAVWEPFDRRWLEIPVRGAPRGWGDQATRNRALRSQEKRTSKKKKQPAPTRQPIRYRASP
jgi:hypothetical protein